MSRRFRTTIRIGEAVRSYPEGGSASTPYAEIGAVYQPSRRDQFNITARYGFEQTANVLEQATTGRFSGVWSHTFNPRFLGSVSANYVNTSSDVGSVTTKSDIYDASLLLQYTFNRHFSMNARYSYTLSKTSTGFSDYDRSRFFVTGQYEF
jgi:hypothetical protein